MRSLLVVLLLMTLLLPAPLLAQSDIPVVYGVFFYSPTCPHCHLVMENDFPRLQAEFGDQFQLLLVNVQTAEGNLLFQSAYNAPNIAVNSLGVPTLVIGREVMVGSIDIPARAFDIVRAGLDSGGIMLPDIPGLREAYAATLAGARQAGVVQAASLTPSRGTFDLADIIASVVLTMLTVSLVVVVGLRARVWRMSGYRLPWFAALATAVFGVVIGLTLAAEALLSLPVLLLSLVEIGALLVVVFVLWKQRPNGTKPAPRLPDWLLPVATIGGLAVAAYLSYVEVTQSDAICGLVGECNLVQQSDYASLFGLLPVGVFGIVGYTVILALWFVGFRLNIAYSQTARTLLLAAALFGVAFSIYLTLLEIFFIGAVCMWCVSSALISLLILWLVAGSGTESPRTISQRPA